MSEISITFRHAEFTAPITNSKRSKLGKREITGGVPVNLADIPENVLWDLLNGAITDFLQAGLKGLDQDSCSREDCQKAMVARLNLLKAGATSTPTAGRKAPTQDPVKLEAKRLLKAAIQSQSDEKIDGRTLTTAVSNLFKQHAQWLKTKDAALEPIAKLVDEAMASARAKFEEQEKLSAGLKAVVAEAKKEAAAKRPTPTERVNAEKKASPKKGRSA